MIFKLTHFFPRSGVGCKNLASHFRTEKRLTIREGGEGDDLERKRGEKRCAVAAEVESNRSL